jgi:hypothetical protein
MVVFSKFSDDIPELPEMPNIPLSGVPANELN